MKKLQTIITFLCIVTSCNQPNQKVYSKAMDETDSLRFQIDILKEEIRKLKSNSMSTNSNNEDFQNFLFQFMTDSLFQIKRTKFPLTYIHWKNNYPGSEIDSTNLTKKNWEHQWLYFNEFSSVPQIYDNFERKLQPTDQRLLHFTGVETGTNAKYFFESKDNRWYLTKMENLGD